MELERGEACLPTCTGSGVWDEGGRGPVLLESVVVVVLALALVGVACAWAVLKERIFGGRAVAPSGTDREVP